eukprot:CAMPEP_0173176464 /NCGR_PEP_ID=MMETSP1141-20130122/4459_1 /TAXON_ID=483371 /ORGANISM="non described non described, Strain CCMP2298" /LENGTH=31 /DNA_ID= /DNA_START= /DNA_END= /DNA_ORIENTATION=
MDRKRVAWMSTDALPTPWMYMCAALNWSDAW